MFGPHFPCHLITCNRCRDQDNFGRLLIPVRHHCDLGLALAEYTVISHAADPVIYFTPTPGAVIQTWFSSGPDLCDTVSSVLCSSTGTSLRYPAPGVRTSAPQHHHRPRLLCSRKRGRTKFSRHASSCRAGHRDRTPGPCFCVMAVLEIFPLWVLHHAIGPAVISLMWYSWKLASLLRTSPSPSDINFAYPVAWSFKGVS